MKMLIDFYQIGRNLLYLCKFLAFNLPSQK